MALSERHWFALRRRRLFFNPVEPDDPSQSVLRRFGDRLRHETARWVGPDDAFHVRLSVEPEQPIPLTTPSLANALLDSARFYHAERRWWLDVFVVMPDHLHSLIAFPQPEEMSQVIGNWKRWQARRQGVRWQDGYFDHRIRDEGDNVQFTSKLDYILNNPVRAGFCERPEDWPWTFQAAAPRPGPTPLGERRPPRA